MPIYEFYCCRCNTLFNFFSKSVNTEKIPDCPHCKTVKLKRQMSIFATVSKKDSEPVTEAPLIDEAKLEKAMEAIAKDTDKIHEDDPRQAVEITRKLSDSTGLKLSDGIEEALSRIEKGEDPERIEEEMGNLLDSQEPFSLEKKKKKRTVLPKPRVDETLYDL